MFGQGIERQFENAGFRFFLKDSMFWRSVYCKGKWWQRFVFPTRPLTEEAFVEFKEICRANAREDYAARANGAKLAIFSLPHSSALDLRLLENPAVPEVG